MSVSKLSGLDESEVGKVNDVAKADIDNLNTLSFPTTTGTRFLDSYSDVQLAFSFRQLKAAAINCIDVRNQSGVTATIGFSAGYLDTTALANHCGSGSGQISKWYDQSGYNRHASQTNTSQMPTIYVSGTLQQVNSKAAAIFGGDRLITSSIQIHTGSFYATCVIKTGASISNAQILNQDDSASSPKVRVAQLLRTGSAGSTARVVVFNTAQQNFKDDSPALSTNTQLQISAYADSTGTLESFDNGTTNGSSTYSGTLFTGSHEVAIGADARANPGGYFSGHIQEIILFDGDQPSNRAAIESNLDTYYAIP